MSKSVFYSTLCLVCALFITSCTQIDDPHSLENRAQYWQRSETTSAIYQRGVKAQQMLNRDIARCVSEIEEMERLGQLQNALPEDYHNPNSHMDNTMKRWETPERIGALRTELMPYHDFESCMQSRGWARTKYVEYDAARHARNDYIENIKGEEWRSDYGGDSSMPGSSMEMHSSDTAATEDPDFKELNN